MYRFRSNLSARGVAPAAVHTPSEVYRHRAYNRPGGDGLADRRAVVDLPMESAALLRLIDRYCAAQEIRPSRFGRMVANDPALVADIRSGRRPSAKLREKIVAILDGRA